MPYYITDSAEGCPGWATVKEDGEIMGCHEDKQSAIDQALAIAQAEGSTFEGEREARDLPDNYRPATSEDVPEGRACGNCLFFNEDNLDEEGRAFCERWEEYVEGGAYCNAWQAREERAEPGELSVGDFVEWDSSGGMARGQISRIVTDGSINVPDSDFTINGTEDDPAALIRIWRESDNDEGEMEWNPTDVQVGHKFSTLTLIEPLDERSEFRQVDLTPPAYMRASARRGLEWHEAGLSGDGLMPATVREARAMSEGNVSADKWVRIRAFLARHMVDFDAPAANPDSDDFPSPGVVAIALWGGGTTRRSAQRAMDYAEEVIGRIEAESENRVTGEALSKLETRVNPAQFEVRETDEGMTFTGYAAVFNSDSQPLPFTERIAPGAFRGSLRNRNDIKLLWNHDTASVLGSSRAGTLKLTEDDRGLYVEAMLPNTTVGRDARELISRGDVDAMSFGFTVARGGDEWSSDGSTRTLTKINLHEVSIVAFPAYTATAGSTAVRGLDKVAKRAEVDPDALADALLKIENGEDISSDDRNLISTVLDKLSPVDDVQPAQNDHGLEMLALKKKKLELLIGK
jgi:HK97 family phage prohead protease